MRQYDPGFRWANRIAAKTGRDAEWIERLMLCLSTCVLYFLLLCICCTVLDSYLRSSSYELFSGEIDYAKIIVGFIMAACGALTIPSDRGATSVFMWAVYAFLVVPRLLLFGFFGWGFAYPLGVFVIFLIAAFLVGHLTTKTLTQNGKALRSGWAVPIVRICMLAIAVATVVALIWMCNLEITPTFASFDFSKTYEIREEITLPKYLGYIVRFLCMRALPLLLAFFLVQKRYAGAVAVSLTEVLFFMMTANKSWLFIIVVLWALALLSRVVVFSPVNLSLITVAAIVLASLIALLPFSAARYPVSLFVRRAIIIPAALGNAYYDFFQEHEIILLSGTPLNPITPLPSEYAIVSYPKQIGAIYYGDSNANTGLFGSEFAHFGVVGWVAMLVNILIIAKFLNLPTSQKGSNFQCLVALLLVSRLLDASSLDVLFSYSGLLFFALYCVISRFLAIDATSNQARNGL